MNKQPTLFVWRGTLDSREQNILKWDDKTICLFCNEVVVPHEEVYRSEGTNYGKFSDVAKCIEHTCPKCGWGQGRWRSWHPSTSTTPLISSEKWTTQKCLKEFCISADDVTIEELGTYLRTNFDDIYSLSPRKFEELIAAIFREHGWQVELTKQSGDGGKDIVMAHTVTGMPALVECKRYSNKVTIDKIDRLIGVQLIEGVKKAFFVTSSDYTSPAKKRIASPNMQKLGFSIELKNGNDLLNMLDCFNELLPPKERTLEKLA